MGIQKDVYAIVGWNRISGDFHRAWQEAEGVEEAKGIFEKKFPSYRVIHAGEEVTSTYDSLEYVSELTNINFVVLNEDGKTYNRSVDIPFKIQIDKSNKIVHFIEVEDNSLKSALRFTIVDSLQDTTKLLLNDNEAMFYLYYKNGGVSKNWHGTLAAIEEKDKEYLIKH